MDTRGRREEFRPPRRHQTKHGGMLLRMFPFLKNKSLISKIKIDNDSIHYISVREYAKKTSDIIDHHMKQKLSNTEIIITDATAGVGGNTISFAKQFKHVNAIEIDSTRAKYLANNTRIYELTNVKVYNDDCLNIVKTVPNHHVIFLDPPWEKPNGASYKQYNNLRLHISDISVEDYCHKLMNNEYMTSVPDLIVLKLPINYDFLHFHSMIPDKKIYYYDLEKMIILVVIVNPELDIVPDIE